MNQKSHIRDYQTTKSQPGSALANRRAFRARHGRFHKSSLSQALLALRREWPGHAYTSPAMTGRARPAHALSARIASYDWSGASPDAIARARPGTAGANFSAKKRARPTRPGSAALPLSDSASSVRPALAKHAPPSDLGRAESSQRRHSTDGSGLLLRLSHTMSNRDGSGLSLCYSARGSHERAGRLRRRQAGRIAD